MAVIYAIRDDDARVRYVGKTKFTAEARLAKHCRDDAKTQHLPLQRWLKKHRDEAYVTVLEATDELDDAERKWIAYFGLENLLNLHPGGNGGIVPGGVSSPEYIAARRATATKPRRSHTPGIPKPPKIPTDMSPAARSARAKRSVETRRRLGQTPHVLTEDGHAAHVAKMRSEETRQKMREAQARRREREKLAS